MADQRHDFLAKLLQPSVIGHLKDYVRWQVAMRQSENPETLTMPETAPLSINLDPTSACNFACDHCVDKNILNTGVQYDFGKLQTSLEFMRRKGLRSVIIIGGGEPTLYRQFGDLVTFLKERGIQVGVVSNGTGLDKINAVADHFTSGDWVRLSLDAGTERTFQTMHQPKGKMVALPSFGRVPISLEQICENARYVSSVAPDLSLGFSYIVTWPNASTNGSEIASNIDEVVAAATLAKGAGFKYLSLKAFLDRGDEDCHPEVVGLPRDSGNYADVVAMIENAVSASKSLETSRFKVVISTNLAALLSSTEKDFQHQPQQCHMTNFRQVLGIRGVAICPVYREESSISIGAMDAYQPSNYAVTRATTAERIRGFDASTTCRNVVCMYNAANWQIENLIRDEISTPGSIDVVTPGPELADYFL